MGAHQPYLYDSEQYDARFPASSFDPKAVTRASYAPKPERPKSDGPLLSFNVHPDAHEVPSGRSPYRILGPGAKKWIQRMRVVQLLLRVLELNGAIGILVLMILINHVNGVVSWVMRITAGVVIVHCIYAIYHLSKHAGARTPGTSTAYHVFASVSDLCVLPLYAFGALAAHNQSEEWQTLLTNQSVMDIFVPAVYYTLIGAGGLHLVSLATGLWLSLKFRQITQMPPDMNPLEDRLTSRARHKKNKSSVATSFTAESEKRLSTPLEDRRRSGLPYEDLSRPPTVPFMATRTGSRESISTRDSRYDLPSRNYQITPGNSPRNSATSAELKRMSTPSSKPRSSYRGSYMEVPLHDTGLESRGSSRPSTGTVGSQVTISSASPAAAAAQPRAAKFTEAWYASESLINRTQERNRALNALNGKRRTYEAISQRHDFPEDSVSELSDVENDENSIGGGGDLSAPSPQHQKQKHPNPLRSNPLGTPPRANTPFRSSALALSEVSLNDRRVSGSQDITEQKPALSPSKSSAKRATWAPRNRDSSIQPDDGFYSKPYGELKSATPPIMVGGGRQVSSGNDYDIGSRFAAYGRRNVSGKAAEEGRAGGHGSYSRYSVLND